MRFLKVNAACGRVFAEHATHSQSKFSLIIEGKIILFVYAKLKLFKVV